MTNIIKLKTGSSFEDQASYSRLVVVDNWIYVSNTAGRNPQTKLIPEDILEQTHQVFANIEAALAAVDASLADVVRVRYMFLDRDDFEPCWPLFHRCFGETRPAATMMVCGLADARMKVEIAVTAHRSTQQS